MAKKIRLGNDIQVTWTLTDGAGNAYDLTGRSFEVYLLCYGWQGRIEDFSVSGNVITFTFWGRDQIKAGTYTAVFIENRDEEAMVTYDASDIFTLVHHSREANGEDGEELETQSVSISSSVTPGIIGPQGLTGNGIAGIEMNDDYTLTITMTDGTSYTTDPIRGETGPAAEITAAAIAEALGYTPADEDDIPDVSGFVDDDEMTAALSGKQDTISDLDTIRSGAAAGATAYQKPSTGIPASDLAAGVIPDVSDFVDESTMTAALAGKQDTINDLSEIRAGAALGATALQSFTETDPTVPSWAKSANKPSYTYSEISNTPDLSQFITKSVDDLTNYYLKSETYTKDEVAALIGAIQQFHYEIAATTSAVTSPAANVLYLIGPTGQGSDRYEEYVYPNSTTGWVKIGDTSIDLSGYVTTTALNTALASYTTTTDLTTLLAGKQNTISDLDTIRSGAEAGATAVQPEDMEEALDEKQDVIDSNNKLDYSLLDNTPDIHNIPAGGTTGQVLKKTSGTDYAVEWANESGGGGGSSNAVEYVQQSLTTQQQAQARENINAAEAFTTKQVQELSVDTTPTANSDNLVTSGGVKAALDDKQAALVGSGTGQNIKTVNDQSLLGTGNIDAKDIFWATYDSTTSAQIEAAYQAGKMVCVFWSNRVYTLIYRSSATGHTFGYVWGGTTYRVVCTSNAWTNTSVSLQNTEDKVSTLTGYESNTSKYPNTKAVYDAIAALPSGTVTNVTAGAGLNTTGDDSGTDGGSITSSGSINLTKSGVTAGTYQGLTVDKYGRVTAASDEGYYKKPNTGIPASDIANGVIPDTVEANPTVPSGTTPASLTGLKVGSDYYSVSGGGGGGTTVEANPTVPSGTTPTDVKGLKIGNAYYDICAVHLDITNNDIDSAINTAWV